MTRQQFIKSIAGHTPRNQKRLLKLFDATRGVEVSGFISSADWCREHLERCADPSLPKIPGK